MGQAYSTGRQIAAVLVTMGTILALVGIVPPSVAAADEQEPNDSRENATAIDIGTTVSGDITGDEADWFSFQAQRGKTINVTGTIGAGVGNDVEIFDSSGELIARGEGFTGESVVTGTTATYTGTYYVKLRPEGMNNDGAEYSFSVRTYTTDAFEPNEDRANATQLTPNTTRSGVISVGDTDWYSFDVQRGAGINVSMSVPPTGENQITLYDEQNNALDIATISGGNVSLVASANQSTTYYAAIVPGYKYGGTNYTLSVRSNKSTAGNESTVEQPQTEETDRSTGQGPPVLLLIGVIALLVVVLLLFVLWRRDDEEEESK